MIARQRILLLKKSFFSLLDPQETQVSQPKDKLKPCSHDHFRKLKTTKAEEVICFGTGSHKIVHSNKILETHWEL